MKRFIERQVSRAYANQGALVRHKAAAFLWTCVGVLPFYLWIVAKDFLRGAGSVGFYLLTLTPLLACLLAVPFLVLRGRFVRSVHVIYAVTVAMHLVAGFLLVRSGLLRTYYFGYALFADSLMLSAAFFVRRWMFHVIACLESLLPLALGLWGIPGAFRGEFERIYGPNIWDGAISRLLVWGTAWLFVSIMDRSISRLERELETNRKLREGLEEMVEERTRELREARLAAERANRAKGVFLADVSHEIRTPVHGVLGMTELLLEEETDPIKARRLRVVCRACDHLLGVVGDVLEDSRIEAEGVVLQPQAVELPGLLHETVDALEILARQAGNELRLELDPGLPAFVVTDALRLRQVLTNLVGNAVKFTKDGTVTLSACGDDGETLRLSVSDTGIGMTSEQCEHVFGRFHQASEEISHRFGGSGLGLALARDIVTAMGGTIGVRSELGKGTRFDVRLPLRVAALPASSVAPASWPIEETGAQGVRVLLVDDDELGLMVARVVLERRGCVVAQTQDADAALALLEREPFDLVLMDCRIPGRIDGIAAARTIRSWKGDMDRRRRMAADTPIVAVTASRLEEVGEDCRLAGIDDVLPKPFQPGDLVLVVERWNGRRHAQVLAL